MYCVREMRIFSDKNYGLTPEHTKCKPKQYKNRNKNIQIDIEVYFLLDDLNKEKNKSATRTFNKIKKLESIQATLGC